MGILSDLFSGGQTEVHEDNSTTERFSTGETITRSPDGTVRETITQTTSLPLGLGEKLTITTNEEGAMTNAQGGWGANQTKK
jgi:hypothetical protein